MVLNELPGKRHTALVSAPESDEEDAAQGERRRRVSDRLRFCETGHLRARGKINQTNETNWRQKRADNSFATGAGVIGFSAVPSEITQQAVAAQQPSETDAWCESGCERRRAVNAAAGA